MPAAAELVRNLPAPVVETHGRFLVVRDDLLYGGSKMRFLPFLVEDAEELVFGGPAEGGAPLALAIIGRMTGRRVSLFYARRSRLHPRQVLARENGARLIGVAPGYMTNVQAKARAYAAATGASFLPLGFDMPAAEQPFVAAMRRVRREVGEVDQVWCCAGSGMLARCLGRAFPDAVVHAVAVGLASRHEAQAFGANVKLHACAYRFDQQCRAAAPFPCCPNYDRKAWDVAQREAKGRALFWNVMG